MLLGMEFHHEFWRRPRSAEAAGKDERLSRNAVTLRQTVFTQPRPNSDMHEARCNGFARALSAPRNCLIGIGGVAGAPRGRGLPNQDGQILQHRQDCRQQNVALATAVVVADLRHAPMARQRAEAFGRLYLRTVAEQDRQRAGTAPTRIVLDTQQRSIQNSRTLFL